MLTGWQHWLLEWNYFVLHLLFLFLPHNVRRDSFCGFLTQNHLVSTWIYAAVFYLFWRMDDDRRIWRRARLVEIVLACVAIVGLTLVIRPWVGWPSPARADGFKYLYPRYLWGTGSHNSFPSHSTLVYFLVALGLWPLERWVAVVLAAWALLAISLPRVYVGGHYPTDVAASMILALLALGFFRQLGAHARASVWLERIVQMGWALELGLFLWLFELGDGFAGAESLLRTIHGARRLGW